MSDYWERRISNAVITEYSLTFSRGFILDLSIYLDYGDFQQGFGGFALHKADTPLDPKGGNYAGYYITRVMQIAGVENLKDVVGKTIRVDHGPDRIYSIGHIIKDDWFNPDEDFNNERN
mgnify:FL=1